MATGIYGDRRYEINDDKGSVIIYASEAMRKIVETLEALRKRSVASYRTGTMFIQGETGTGKELIARAVHYNGPCASGPFRAINCAAISKDLLESELFGHIQGAFTSASGGRKGEFLTAQNGTLFLDEVGDMPYDLQAKILRVLEERAVKHVGSDVYHPLNITILAGTNRNPGQLIASNQFREDLYYRLSTVEIAIAPLRDRREDIVPMVAYFQKLMELELGSTFIIPEEIKVDMAKRDWPGNGRELRNAVARLGYATLNGGIALSTIDGMGKHNSAHQQVTNPDKEGLSLDELLCETEKNAFIAALNATGGNKARAAARLGINRSTFNYRLAKHGFDPSN